MDISALQIKENKMKKVIVQSISLILLFTLALPRDNNVLAMTRNSLSQANTIYYVNPLGNDSNPGTINAPFKTLSKSVAMLLPGDTLIISGTFDQTLNVSKSGSSGAPITIIGNNAVLDMKGVNASGIILSGNFLTVTGFEVKNTTSHGILISGKNVQLENSRVHHSVRENGYETCNGTGSWGSALKVMIGAQNIILRGNLVYENCGEGIAITRGINVVVENNIVRDNFSVNIYSDNSPYTTIQNNNVSCTGIYLRNGNRPTGIALAEEDYSGWGIQRHNQYVFGNFVDGCSDGIASWKPEISGGKLIDSEISGNTVINGIKRSIAIYSENQNVVIQNNSVYADIVINYPSGVTTVNNTKDASASITKTSTITSTATSFTNTPTATPAVSYPSPTSTATSASIYPSTTPTATSTGTYPTPTPTAISTINLSTPTIVISTASASFTPIFTATMTNSVIKTTTPNQTSTPSATQIASSSKDIKFDDRNINIYYSKGWNSTSDPKAYEGSYQTNSNYGAAITINFIGESFSVIYTDGANYRRMEVYLDGNLIQTIMRSSSKTKYQMQWDYPGMLSNGQHVVKLVFPNGRGTFDGFIIRPRNGQILPYNVNSKPTITFTTTLQTIATSNTSISPTFTPTSTLIPTELPSSTPVQETSTLPPSNTESAITETPTQ